MIYLCNPSRNVEVRAAVNSDLLLRHTVTVVTDIRVPYDIIYVLENQFTISEN